MLADMAGLLIFIGIGIIVSTVLRTQARRRKQRNAPDERLRRLRDQLDRDHSRKEDDWDK